MSSAPFIETFTGKRFQPLAPKFADICIEDVAHALSNQCRFSGHVRHFYSVAEHSVRVSRFVAATTNDVGLQLWGLLHDASEAFLVDLPTPLKVHPALGEEYKRAERRVMRAVCKRFGLPPRQPSIVHVADARLLATEVRDLMYARPSHWVKVTAVPLFERITPWAPKTAEAEFLYRFNELTRAT